MARVAKKAATFGQDIGSPPSTATPAAVAQQQPAALELIEGGVQMSILQSACPIALSLPTSSSPLSRMPSTLRPPFEDPPRGRGQNLPGLGHATDQGGGGSLPFAAIRLSDIINRLPPVTLNKS